MKISIRLFYKWEWRWNNIVNFTNPIWNCDFYVARKRISAFLGFFLSSTGKGGEWRNSLLFADSTYFSFLCIERNIVALVVLLEFRLEVFSHAVIYFQSASYGEMN